MGLSRKVSKKPQFIVTKNAAVWHFWLLVLSTLFKSPLNFIDTNLIKANFQVLLFHRSRRGFPSLLRYGQRRRVTDTVVLVFFHSFQLANSCYFWFMYEPPGPTVGHLQLFQKQWQMPDKCSKAGEGGWGRRMRTYAWNCDWPIKHK